MEGRLVLIDRTEFIRDPLILLELITFILDYKPNILHDAFACQLRDQVSFYLERSLMRGFYNYQAIRVC